jgi:hypothetical protein
MALDSLDLEVYDISWIVAANLNRANSLGSFKCFIDQSTGEFFFEISEKTPLNSFSQSLFLEIIDAAEKAKTKTVYACFRRDTIDISKDSSYIKNIILFFPFLI